MKEINGKNNRSANKQRYRGGLDGVYYGGKIVQTR